MTRGDRTGRRALWMFVLCAFGLTIFPATGAAQPVPADRVTVVMTELAPFVIQGDAAPDGFYAEIWDEVASSLSIEYDVLWVESFPEVLAAIETGTADIAVAPLAPTAEREALFDFSSAVVSSGPQMGVSNRLDGRPSVIRSLFDRRVLGLVAIAIGALLLVAHVIWLLERRRHEDDGDFHQSYLLGIWDGLWWSTVRQPRLGTAIKRQSRLVDDWSH